MHRLIGLGMLAGALALTGCDALFGSKGDPTTDEIFDEGEIDPTLIDEVGYVPLNPFYTNGGTGAPLDRPTDVYVGYDELLYVADAQGLHVLDRAGRPQAFLGEIGWPGGATQPLRGITAIVQDRRLDLYVAARRDTTVAGAVCRRYPGEPERCDLPVIYRISGLTTGNPQVADILWYPFDDRSRDGRFENPRTYTATSGAVYSDEDASFTGVATLADNRLYAVRSGPVNTAADGRPNTTVSPFNAFLVYTAEGQYVQYVRQLTPDRPTLLSAFWPTDVITFIGPPQTTSLPSTEDFILAQAPPSGVPPRYGVLSVRVVATPDGTEYRVDTERLNAANGGAAGDGFLYEEDQFVRPTALAYAPDGTGYLFVLDAAKDSLFVFNARGVEGVAPPPGAGNLRPVRVSFGGEGSGALQFRDPEGVAYFERTVYVADTGNNRIARYRLNTDLE